MLLEATRFYRKVNSNSSLESIGEETAVVACLLQLQARARGVAEGIGN